MTNSDLQKALEALFARLESDVEQIEELEDAITDLKATISSLEDDVIEGNSTITDLQDTITELNRQLQYEKEQRII